MPIVEAPNMFGCIPVKTILENGQVHRRVLEPGHLENGAWVDTDISQEPQEIVNATTAAWTPEIKAVWEAFLRANLPPPLDLDVLDTEAINRLLIADGSVVRAMAQVQFALINEVRALKGQAPITVAQYKAQLKSLIR